MTKQKNLYNRLYGTSPGQSYLSITGARLPTYLQVLLCYKSVFEKLKAETKGTKRNLSWKTEALQTVYKEVTYHYKKASIEVKSFNSFCYDFEKVLEHHHSLVKGCKGKIDIKGTMPLWPKNIVTTMKKKMEQPFLSQKEKKNNSKLT